MPLIEINLDPSERELKWFGVLALAFFVLAGGVAYWLAAAAGVAYALLGFGVAFCVIFYLARPMRKVMYRAWLRLFQPVGWIIGHTLFAIIFFGVFSLIGLCLRIFRYDPMQRDRRTDVDTYWEPRTLDESSSRYFRQF